MKDAPPRNFARLHSHWLLMADTIYGANLNSMYSYVEANNQRNFSQLLWFDGQGLCLFSKRLDKGHFQWPVTDTGAVSLTPAQLSMLLEGIDWRMPARVRRPELAG